MGLAATGGFSCVSVASAAPIQVPTIDKLSIRVLVDQQHDQFLKGSTVNGVVHDAPGGGRSADARNVLHNEWGLSLLLESQREQELRNILLDFGYTSPAIINNIGLLNVDPAKINALSPAACQRNGTGQQGVRAAVRTVPASTCVQRCRR